MVTLVKLMHSRNAEFPIVVTESGMVMRVKLLHLLNAISSIEVTESGMVNWVFVFPIAY